MGEGGVELAARSGEGLEGEASRLEGEASPCLPTTWKDSRRRGRPSPVAYQSCGKRQQEPMGDLPARNTLVDPWGLVYVGVESVRWDLVACGATPAS